MFDAGKTRMIGLPYGEKNCDDMLSRFHVIPERYGQTDVQTHRFAISISRVSMLTRDNKNSASAEVADLRLSRRSSSSSNSNSSFFKTQV